MYLLVCVMLIIGTPANGEKVRYSVLSLIFFNHTCPENNYNGDHISYLITEHTNHQTESHLLSQLLIASAYLVF